MKRAERKNRMLTLMLLGWRFESVGTKPEWWRGYNPAGVLVTAGLVDMVVEDCWILQERNETTRQLTAPERAAWLPPR
jgi:hypothetical protein